jgi:PRC-barrel domain
MRDFERYAATVAAFVRLAMIKPSHCSWIRHRNGAIISVGGFLGVGQKDVVIPFKELKVSTRDGKDWLVLNRTKDELKLAPAYNNTGSPSEYRGQ